MSKKTGWQKRRRISIAWGYYVMVDKLNHTLYKNGDIKPIGFYNDLESAVSGLVRIHEPRLADSDLIEEIKSDKNQLKYGLCEKDRTKTIITVEAYIKEKENEKFKRTI